MAKKTKPHHRLDPSVRCWTFHTNDVGDIHDGPEAGCRLCVHLEKNKELYLTTEIGRAETKALALAEAERRNCKQCAACTTMVPKRNKSGFCKACRQKHLAERKAWRLSNAYKRTCSVCEKPIYTKNISGLCSSCRNKRISEEAKARREAKAREQADVQK